MTPHYVRFARALSLVVGVAGCGSEAAATDASFDTGSDSIADAGLDVGPEPAGCSSCTCCGHDSGTGTDLPACQSGHNECCIWQAAQGLVCGPLAPPDLA